MGTGSGASHFGELREHFLQGLICFDERDILLPSVGIQCGGRQLIGGRLCIFPKATPVILALWYLQLSATLSASSTESVVGPLMRLCSIWMLDRAVLTSVVMSSTRSLSHEARAR